MATQPSVTPLCQSSEHVRSDTRRCADSMKDANSLVDAVLDTACDAECENSFCSENNDSTSYVRDSHSDSLQLRRDWYSAVTTFAAGGIAGSASRTLTAPLDRIKTIMQEDHLVSKTALPESHGIRHWVRHSRLVDAARLIKQDGGWAAFWRGNLVNCFKAGPEFAVVFTLRRYMFSIYEEIVENERAHLRDSTVAHRSPRKYTTSSPLSSSATVHPTAQTAPCNNDDDVATLQGSSHANGLTTRLPCFDEHHRQSNMNDDDRTSSNSKSRARPNGNVISPHSCHDSCTGHHTGIDDTVSNDVSSTPSASFAAGDLNAETTAPYVREHESRYSNDASEYTSCTTRDSSHSHTDEGVPCTFDNSTVYSGRYLHRIPLLFVNCTIGAIAGLVAQSILYPMELVKTRVVVSRRSEYVGGVRGIIYDAYRRGGVREFYRGFTPNMIGIVVYRGLEMGLYSNAQQSLMLYRMQFHHKTRHEAALSSAEVAVVGAFASIVAQTISYPLNVVRTRLQTQGSNGRVKKYSGMTDCFVKIIRHKGVSALFSGLTANYLKAVPASACTFIVFEKMQSWLIGDD